MAISRLVIAWATFFLIAFGLGYPTLNRYDARNADPDVITYYNLVTDEPTAQDDSPLGMRVLLPGLARPFYRMSIGRLGSWNPVYFGLLVSSSMFTATAASLLLLIGLRLNIGTPLAWLGSTIFLLNFVVSNYWLSGLVDSSEGCLLLAVAWCLFANRWWPLMLLGILCAMAKQSTPPFALLFSAVWWLNLPRSKRLARQIAYIAGMGIAGIVTLVLVYRIVRGSFLPPWTMAGWYVEGSWLDNIKGLLVEGRFWYAFVWLVPLGIWRLNRLPKPWVVASLATASFALFMAVLSHLGGTVNRAVFNILGPVLSLSAAMFLSSSSSSPDSGKPHVRIE